LFKYKTMPRAEARRVKKINFFLGVSLRPCASAGDKNCSNTRPCLAQRRRDAESETLMVFGFPCAPASQREKIIDGITDHTSRRGAETQRMTENEIGTKVIEAAIAVHRELGPGLLETVYEAILARELVDRGLKVERQVAVPILYKDIRFEEGFRADLIVESKVILELKSVERVRAAHKKQVQTYLRLTGCRLGYLLNFGEVVMKAGITRCVNGLEE